jgi:hypothetical protein
MLEKQDCGFPQIGGDLEEGNDIDWRVAMGSSSSRGAASTLSCRRENPGA